MKKGFTLAEILVVLAILGTVAAILIPSAYSNYQKKVLATQLKRNYAILQNAMDTAVVLHRDEVWNGGYFSRFVVPNLRVRTDCTGKRDCLPVRNYKGLRLGTDERNEAYCLCNRNGNFDDNACFHTKLILNTGAIVVVRDTGEIDTPRYYEGRINGNNKDLYIDVNGEKGPNRENYDLFKFSLSRERGLTPHSSENGECPNYTKRVLTKGTIDY